MEDYAVPRALDDVSVPTIDTSSRANLRPQWIRLPALNPERLTRAAAAASSAGPWDVVKQALEELRAWRLEKAGPNVVALDARKRGQ